MAKPSITKRTTKGAALTYSELDTNFQNLADATVSLTAGSGGTQVTADLNGNITIVAGTNVTITGDNTAKTITINAPVAGSNATTVTLTAKNTGTDQQYIPFANAATGNQTLFTDVALYYYPTSGTIQSTEYSGATVYASTTVNTPTITNPSGTTVSITDKLIIGPSGNIQIGYESGGTHRIECTGPLLIATETTFNGSVTGPSINMGNGPNGGSIIIGTDEIPDDKIYFTDVINVNSITSTQRTALVNPQNGDLIYNQTTHKFQGYANGTWVDLH